MDVEVCPSHEPKEGETSPKEDSGIQECDVRAAVLADKGEEAKVTSWTVEDVGKKGDNYLSMVKLVRAQVSIGGREEEVTYIVKVKLSFSSAFQEFSNTSFFKEQQFYAKLLPELNGRLEAAGLESLRVPKFYHHYKSEERELIILEDLLTQGFSLTDRRKGLDTAHAQLVLKELGRFHASSVLVQNENPHEDLGVKHKFLNINWFNYADTAREKFVITLGGELQTAAAIAENSEGFDEVAQWLRKLLPEAVGILERQMKPQKPFVVLLHGDCWTNNFLFRYNSEGVPVEVMLLDFQDCSTGSPAIDFQTMMYSSILRQSRKENLRLFLQTYMDSFRATLIAGGSPPPFSFEELQEEYRAKGMFGALMAVMCIPVMVADAKDAPDYTQVGDDVEQFFRERKEQVLEMMQRNPLVGEWMCGAFDDWRENGLMSKKVNK